jgi:methyl-accepting chemotaxis protein
MLNNFTVKNRLILMTVFSAVLAITLSMLGLVGMQKSDTGLQNIYLHRTLPLTALAEIQTKLLHNRTAIVTGFPFPQEIIKQHAKIDKDIADITKLWEEYKVTDLTLEERKLADKFSADSQRFFENIKTTMALQRSENLEEAKKFYFKDVRNSYNPAADSINALIKLQKDITKQEYEASETRFHHLLTASIAICVMGLSLMAVIAVTVIRGISGALKSVQQVATAIAVGNLDSQIDSRQKNEIGALLGAMQTIQDAFNAFKGALNTMAKQHAEGLVKEQLDNTLFPGIYGKMAEEINELIQSRIAINKRIIYIVQQYAKGDFSLDMDVLPGETVVITETMDSIKKALLDINTEIHSLVASGVKGDFSKRVHADRFEFVFKEILTDLNDLIKTCDSGFGDVERVSKALAQGDLTQTISKAYPGTFGQVTSAMNDTVDHLKTMIREIKESSNTINTAAKEIASGNNDLSHRTEEQAASLEETAASMQELTATVHLNTEHAKQANQLTFSATNIATKGVKVVSEVVKTMDSIHESSRKVVDIIGVIDSIAFQTNILALNAAVEAARAGDQGRGFAVVAGEVRNLAQRAATAASEIKELIGDSVEQIEGGTRLVTHAGNTMTEIANSIRGVTVIMSEIASASEQQTSGIDQVNLAIEQMDDVTQQNAALVEQAAAAAESLEEQTQNLSVTVEKFKV